MKQEYSYGAVVYKEDEQGTRTYLIEKMRLGHVSLPKGHIEKGETPRECALREILEETGLKIAIDSNFSHTISYSPKEGIQKDVTFYPAKFLSGTITPQMEEVVSASFMTLDEALSILTYDADKETLVSIDRYLTRLSRR